MHVIIVNGYSGCGKDFFISKAGFFRTTATWSRANWAKRIILNAVNETDANMKNSELVDNYRKALIYLTRIGRDKGFVLEDLKKSYSFAKKNYVNFFFIQVRDVEDIDNIKKEFDGAFTLLLNRKGILPSNEQDSKVVDYSYDIELDLVEIGEEFGPQHGYEWNSYLNQVEELLEYVERNRRY